MKKKISLLLVLVLSILVVIPVQAKDFENFNADDSLSLSTKIDSTLFAAGNSVKVTSEVDGSSFIAGNMLSISSKQDYLFAAGNNLVLSNVTAKDAFVAGSFITIDNSTIRDLYVAGSMVTINSDITRNVYVGGGTVEINGTVEGNVNLACETLKIGPDAVIRGKLIYPEESKVEGDLERVGEKETYKSEVEKKDVDVKVNVSPVAVILGKVFSTLYRYIAMLIIALILLALNKKFFEGITTLEKSFGKVALSALLGFALLVLLPVASIIVMITIIGIPLSLVCLTVYGLLIYLSIIPTAYYFGNMMFGKAIKNKYGLLTLSLLIIYILKAIPIVGGVVGFVSLIIGLGLYLTVFKNLIKEKK